MILVPFIKIRISLSSFLRGSVMIFFLNEACVLNFYDISTYLCSLMSNSAHIYVVVSSLFSIYNGLFE